MADTVYATLTKTLKLKPEEDESEQDFYERAVKAGNKLSDTKFEGLPQECQDWLDEATTAVKEKVAIPAMPGATFDDDDTGDDDEENEDDEDADDSPEDDEEEENGDTEDDNSEDDDEDAEAEEEEEGEAPPPKKRGRPAKAAAKPAEKAKAKAAAPAAKKAKAAPEPAEEDGDETEEDEEEAPPKKSAKAAKGKSGTRARDEKPDPKKVAAKVDKRVQKKNKVLKIGRTRSTDGVLYKLMEAMYEDPTRTASVLVDVVQKENKGMKVKTSNAIGIRQQYRRIVLFLQDKGAVKGMIEGGAAE